MALTAAKTFRTTQTAISDTGAVESGVTVFNGGFVGLKDFAHATAAQRGRVDVWDASDGMLPVAPNEGPGASYGVAQDNSSAVGNAGGTVEVGVKLEPYFLPDVTVTGLVDEEDVGRYVYLTDDDVTANLTLTNNGNPVGLVWKYNSGTTGKVLMFGFLLARVLAAAGYGFSTVPLGSLDVNGVTGETGLQFEAQQRYLLVGYEGSVVEAGLGGGALTMTVEVRKDGVACHAAGERLTFVGTDAKASRRESNVTEASIAVIERGTLVSIAFPANAGVTGIIGFAVRLLALGG